MSTISYEAYNNLRERADLSPIKINTAEQSSYNSINVTDILKDAQLVVTITEYRDMQGKMLERPFRDEENFFGKLNPKITMTLKEMRELEEQLKNAKDEKSKAQIREYLSKAQLVLTLEERNKLENDKITAEEHKKIANAQYYITLREMIAFDKYMMESKELPKELRNILKKSLLVVPVNKMIEILTRKEPINDMLKEKERVENANLMIINDNEMNKWFPVTPDNIRQVTEGVTVIEKSEAGEMEETMPNGINSEYDKGV